MIVQCIFFATYEAHFVYQATGDRRQSTADRARLSRWLPSFCNFPKVSTELLSVSIGTRDGTDPVSVCYSTYRDQKPIVVFEIT